MSTTDGGPVDEPTPRQPSAGQDRSRSVSRSAGRPACVLQDPSGGASLSVSLVPFLSLSRPPRTRPDTRGAFVPGLEPPESSVRHTAPKRVCPMQGISTWCFLAVLTGGSRGCDPLSPNPVARGVGTWAMLIRPWGFLPLRASSSIPTGATWANASRSVICPLVRARS